MAGEFERLIEQKKISETLGNRLIERSTETYLIMVPYTTDPRKYARELKKEGTISGQYRTAHGPLDKLLHLLPERNVHYIVAEIPTIFIPHLAQREEIEIITQVARLDLPKSLRIYQKSRIFGPRGPRKW